ncbi:MAG TPA: hypothetical protein VE153_09820, partial [Myxococcus sp.]|nr:hypothetical protein [Myxococcus sp.]
ARLESLEKPAPRRRLARWGYSGALLAPLLVAGVAFAHLADSSGEVLRQWMDLSSPHVTAPALDTMVRWQRRDPEGVAAGYTNEILSLITDSNQQNSYSWPLYIELRGTTHPGATQASSQSVGATVRMFNRSTGSPWQVGFHSEVGHGRNGLDFGPLVDAHGTSILFNGEVRSYTTNGRTVGANLQCTYTDGSSKPCNRAINIQSTSATTYWQDGIYFDSGSSYTAGNIGVNFGDARFNMGLDLANNSMRLNAGQRIYLERFGTAYMWFNQGTNRIELVRGGSVVASF